MTPTLRFTAGLVLLGNVCSTHADVSDTVYRFPSVSVTALRSSELVAIPYALSLIDTTGAALRRSYGIEGMLAHIPGVFVQSRSGSSDLRIVVRGFGARGAGDRSNNGTTRGVRILLDGAPLTEPDGRTALDLLEPAVISQGVILRSNATLLWGNASGGILAFRTAPWSSEHLLLAAASGSFGYRKFSLQLQPLDFPEPLRATVVYTASRGWRRHSDAERFWLGLQLGSQLDRATTLEWSAAFTRNRFSIPGPVAWETFLQTPEAANPTYESQHARRENTLAFLAATLRAMPTPQHLVSATFFAQPKFLIRSERGTYREFARFHTGASILFQTVWEHAPFSIEVTSGGDGALQDGPALFYRLTPSGGRDSTLLQNKREAALSAGAFLRLTARIHDRLILWAGTRLEWLQYRLIDALKPSLSAVHHFRQLLPSLGLSYRLSEHHSLYLHASSGWEVPAYNEIDPPPTQSGQGINTALQPMDSWTVEVGSRHRFEPAAGMVRAFELETALFAIDVRNELVPYGGGRFYLNAARSRRIGLELQWNATFPGGWGLQHSLWLASLRYVRYQIDSSVFGSPGQEDFSGNAVAGVPSATTSLRLHYAPEWLPVVAEVEFSYVGRMYADDANAVTVPDYALWNLAVRWNSRWRILGLQLIPWVSLQNLANRRYVGSVYVNPDRDAQGRALFAEAGLPRSLVAGIQVGAGK